MKQSFAPTLVLYTRNVRIENRRTSVRLESAFWSALEHAAHIEGLTVHALCTQISTYNQALGLTAALRVFLLAYIWSGSLEESLITVQTGKISLIR